MSSEGNTFYVLQKYNLLKVINDLKYSGLISEKNKEA